MYNIVHAVCSNLFVSLSEGYTTRVLDPALGEGLKNTRNFSWMTHFVELLTISQLILFRNKSDGNNINHKQQNG